MCVPNPIRMMLTSRPSRVSNGLPHQVPISIRPLPPFSWPVFLWKTFLLPRLPTDTGKLGTRKAGANSPLETPRVGARTVAFDAVSIDGHGVESVWNVAPRRLTLNKRLDVINFITKLIKRT